MIAAINGSAIAASMKLLSSTDIRIAAEGVRFAEIIAANGPLAVRAVKESVLKSMGRPVEEGS